MAKHGSVVGLCLIWMSGMTALSVTGCKTASSGTANSMVASAASRSPASGTKIGKLGPFVLVQPTKVRVEGSDNLLVSFSVPCRQVDFDRVVAINDDSGDMVMHVGVIYPKSECDAGPLTTFERTVPAPVDDAGVEFKPMTLPRFALLSPLSVTKTASGALSVVIAAACGAVDFERLVAANDDSGDRVAHIGVVYDTAQCDSSNHKAVTRTINPGTPEYTELFGEEDAVDYVRMNVESGGAGPAIAAGGSVPSATSRAAATSIQAIRCRQSEWSLSLDRQSGTEYTFQVLQGSRSVVNATYQLVKRRPAGGGSSETQYIFTDSTDGGAYLYRTDGAASGHVVFDLIGAYTDGRFRTLDFPDCLIK